MKVFRYVIVGNSSAGIAAAQAIRARDKEGSLAVLSEEGHVCYYRPNLDGFVAGKFSHQELYLYRPTFYQEQGIDLMLNKKAVKTLPEQNKLLLDDGAEIRYERLLLATGARPRTYPWPGAKLKAITTFRTLKDAETIVEMLPKTRAAVVVGGGLLGIDMVQALGERGIPVTHLVRDNFVGSPVMDRVGGKIIEQKMLKAGVNLMLEEEVAYFLGENGSVCGLKTVKGKELKCQLVIVCVGVDPRAEIAEQRGITAKRGIPVDEYQETEIKNIFAAGDVALVMSGITGNRMNQTSWYNSTMQGTTAGTNMAEGPSLKYEEVPYNYIDIYGLHQTTFGVVDPKEADEVLTGDYPQGLNYKKLFIKGNGIIGGMYLTEELEDVWSIIGAIKRKADISGVKADLLKPGFSVK